MFEYVSPLDVKLHEGSVFFLFYYRRPSGRNNNSWYKEGDEYIYIFNKDIKDWQNKEQTSKELMKKKRHKTNVMEHAETKFVLCTSLHNVIKDRFPKAGDLELIQFVIFVL